MSTDVQAPGAKEDSRRLGQHLGAAIRRVMAEEMQPGGVIYNANERWRR